MIKKFHNHVTFFSNEKKRNRKSRNKIRITVFLVSLLTISSIALSGRVSTEAAASTTAVITYVYPPITTYRVYPDTVIPSNFMSNEIHIRSCPGEFTPATFVVKPTTTVTSFLATPSTLQKGIDTISSSNIDISAVKCWYQRGDKIIAPSPTYRLFVPELLLKDDSLVQVEYTDMNNGLNYLRTSEGYKSINYPRELGEYVLVYDSATLQPLRISANTNKQYWVTVYIPEGTPDGTYTGTITLSNSGTTLATLQLSVEVLPFSLPASPVEISIYYTQRVVTTQPRLSAYGGRTVEQYHAEFKDMKNHGITNPIVWIPVSNTNFDTYMQIRQSEGMSLNNFYYHGWEITADQSNTLVQTKVKEVKTWLQNHYPGQTENYYFYVEDEENPLDYISQIAACRYAGGKTFDAGGRTFALNAINHNPPLLDLCVFGGPPNYSVVTAYHTKNMKIGSYSNPQVGEEKPVTYRRNYGLLLWQNDIDVSMDFSYASGDSKCLWNDWDNSPWKEHVFAYPTSNGVVDTIQFEGFREGVNDLRYLQKLIDMIDITDANGMDTTTELNYVNYLKSVNLETSDLDGIRNQIINYILSLSGSNVPPTADFTYNLLSPTDVVIQFTDQSIDSDGTLASWSWDFGDGGTSALQNPVHDYADNKTYHVTLTVTDDDGASDTISKNVGKKEFYQALIFGKVTILSTQGEYIQFEAVNTGVITFSPFNISVYVSREKFTIENTYLGFLYVPYIFALCKIQI